MLVAICLLSNKVGTTNRHSHKVWQQTFVSGAAAVQPSMQAGPCSLLGTTKYGITGSKHSIPQSIALARHSGCSHTKGGNQHREQASTVTA